MRYHFARPPEPTLKRTVAIPFALLRSSAAGKTMWRSIAESSQAEKFSVGAPCAKAGEASASETAYGSAFEGAVGVRKAGDYVYVADLARGLVILREL